MNNKKARTFDNVKRFWPSLVFNPKIGGGALFQEESGFIRSFFEANVPGNTYWRERLCTVDLPVLTNLDPLIFILKLFLRKKVLQMFVKS